ncbi:12862_t:CDS:2 [Dentiscutata erythropus]|uniref:12862_t:CDS:1 n=1 Tax=Dentiscutata erythropus TaxID=1348616 RepID=A0A9N9BZR5_9GLOM|nr:12862_t:CDS:2 [Dentiscutata erythropus]
MEQVEQVQSSQISNMHLENFLPSSYNYLIQEFSEKQMKPPYSVEQNGQRRFLLNSLLRHAQTLVHKKRIFLNQMLPTSINFYKVTPVQEWTITNIIKYYRKELNIQLELSKILDDIKKNLYNVADVKFGLDDTRRIKARELINTWKPELLFIPLGGTETIGLQWEPQLFVECGGLFAQTPIAKKASKTNRVRKKIGVVRVKQQLNAKNIKEFILFAFTITVDLIYK